MQLGNFHVHSTGSDGKLSPEETAKLAISKGLNFICFTDHYPYPPGFDDFRNNLKRFFPRTSPQELKEIKDRWRGFCSDEYFKDLEQLKQEFKNKIEVYTGAEFNWIQGYKDWLKKETQKRNYDFALISVHKVLVNENYYPLNWSEDIFNKALKQAGNIKNLIKEYYNQVRKAAQSKIFDCIAHLDLIKCWNKDSKYFSEDSDWYRQEVLKTLDEISKAGIAIEINTSGWTEHNNNENPFPSPWIIAEARKRNILITIGADSHKPEQLDYKLKEAIELAKESGYNHIVKYKNRKPIKIPI